MTLKSTFQNSNTIVTFSGIGMHFCKARLNIMPNNAAKQCNIPKK